MPASSSSLLQVSILSVGKIKQRELAPVARDYAGRISRDIRLNMESIKDSSPEQEAPKLLARISKHNDFVFAFFLIPFFVVLFFAWIGEKIALKIWKLKQLFRFSNDCN